MDRIETPSAARQGGTILVINCGSSSVKFAAFANLATAPRLWRGAVEGVGLKMGRFIVSGADGAPMRQEAPVVADHLAALDVLLTWLDREIAGDRLEAVGHRLVHGGDGCDCPLLVTPALEARLRQLVPLAPLHLPHNLAGIVAVRVRRPDVPQVACFDTAFHQRLPSIARMTGLPPRFEKEGVRRYGFHGLSYEYVVEALRRRHGESVAEGRLIVAHLGSGASMAAIHRGKSVETTMGFSTLSGLPMGTRCGDLDPGIVLYLMTEKGMAADEVRRLLYEGSGLLGLSGISADMKELLARRDDQAANRAVAYFCYQARKHLVALTSTLGGLDRVVFTGGIGAHAPGIRARICDGLGYLGITLDAERNQANERTISAVNSAVVVEAFPTDEERMIARHVQRLLAQRPVAQEA